MKAVVRQALVSLGGEASLSRLYEAVAEHAPALLAGRNTGARKLIRRSTSITGLRRLGVEPRESHKHLQPPRITSRGLFL